MPTNYWQAIYSVAWAVAMVVHSVPPGPDWFSNSRLSDPQYRVTSAKVSVLEHPPASLALQQLDFHRLEGWVEIDTTDTTLRGSKSMNDTYGSPSHPMPEPMFRDKFQRVVEPSLGRAPAASLYAALGSVSSLTDVRQLQPLLAPGSQLQ